MPISLFISTDVFSNGPFTTNAMAATSQRSHTHTLTLGLSTSLLYSPFISVWYKNPGNHFQIINWIKILNCTLVLISEVSSQKPYFGVKKYSRFFKMACQAKYVVAVCQWCNEKKNTNFLNLVSLFFIHAKQTF
jgi:hypothetical protein